MADEIKILVVDDEPIVIRSCETVLKSEGYNIEGCLGGKEAILKMEQTAYDLVFTDLKMPEVDGITLIRWIKQKRPDTGIVIITGYPSQDTIKDALEIGIIDYVPKPFTPAVLLDVTKRAVEWIRERAPVEEKAKEEEFPPSMLNEIDRVISQYKNRPGSSIPVLQRCQQIVGYLPPQVQKRIAKGLNLTPAQIHSIVSFYSFFTMKPRGDHNIRICLGTACYVKRVEESLNKIKEYLKIDVGDVTEDKKFSLETVRCLGACGLAPVMVIDEETFGAVTPKKVTEIIGQYT
ncbi:MAG TPA: response regulator [Nitrospirae bacterium]|nr:NADP-reducing hydrogenase subunit HndA [bacterium BMS3Abin06]HDH11755.1 response regulator [Nitrospirota bacterium]HDL19715.1 response regulator [Nitrospirota bacterium]HDZ02591.1 response regulator [Nitrospirota bacterium]